MFTEDDLLGGAVRIRQPERGYRVTSDAVLLAALTPLHAQQQILDLGTGYGQVAICLLARQTDLRVTGLELMPEAAALARQNAALNGVTERFSIVSGDVRSYDGQGQFDCVVSNPPYRDADTHTPSPDPIKAAATVLQQPLTVWTACARRALREEGALVMIIDARQESDLLRACASNGFGNVQSLPLLSFAEAALPKRVVVHARLGGSAPPQRLPGLVLHESGGGFRPEIRNVLAKVGALSPWL